MTNEIELAWAAGFFDGEGNIQYFYKKDASAFGLKLCVNQADAGVLYRFNAATKELGNIRGPYDHYKKKNNNWSLIYNYNAYGSIACEVFLLLKPYLSEVKLEQGQKAIKQYSEYRSNSRNCRNRWIKYREKLLQEGLISF